MGTTLTGTQINNTYPSLLKTTDNSAIGATLKKITDGEGNDTPLSMASNYIQLSADTIELIEPTGGTNLIQISPVETYFEGTVNFTNATVNGLPSAAGLVAGTGIDSMKSADTLTTAASTASNTNSIAIGGGNTTTGNGGVSLGSSLNNTGGSAINIGRSNTTSNGDAIYIGTFGSATGSKSIAMGNSAGAGGGFSIALGRLAQSLQTSGIAIGNTAKSRAQNSINIGDNSIVDDSVRVDTVSIGANSKSAQYSTSIGAGAFAIGENAVAISDATAAAPYGVAIGWDAAANSAAGSVALGRFVNAVNWTDSTTVNRIAYADYANLNFADDTAAATGGVPLGGVYHNAGALRIRIA